MHVKSCEVSCTATGDAMEDGMRRVSWSFTTVCHGLVIVGKQPSNIWDIRDIYNVHREPPFRQHNAEKIKKLKFPGNKQWTEDKEF